MHVQVTGTSDTIRKATNHRNFPSNIYPTFRDFCYSFDVEVFLLIFISFSAQVFTFIHSYILDIKVFFHLILNFSNLITLFIYQF